MHGQRSDRCIRRTHPAICGWVPALLCMTLLLVVPVGCGSSPDAARDPDEIPITPVNNSDVVGAYNARAERITSLWSRASVVLEGEDAEGRDLRERAEGHLQIVPPNHVAITLGKIGETHLYFGSNDALYWWFDMTDSGFKVARFGRHALVTPEKIDRLGLPIHPLDLVETIGITPLPVDPANTETIPGDESGTTIIVTPTRRVTIHSGRAEPSRIELTGPDGQILLGVDLSRYRLMGGLEPGEAPLRIPERVRVRMAGFDGEIRISLFEPTRREIKPVAFDPSTLADVYGLDALLDLDRPAEDPGAPPVPPG